MIKISRKAINAKEETDVSEEFKVPITIFSDRSLSILEVLVEYLKENNLLTYHKIASLLNRDDRTIWTVYSRVKKKRETIKPSKTTSSTIEIPLSIFNDRKLSFFECLVEYSMKRLGLTLHVIASILNRDDRTIWTLSDRAAKKRGGA